MERVAVVTGAGSGVGRSVCAHLASDGCRVAVLDRDGDAASEVAAELRDRGAEAVDAVVDVADRASVDAALGVVRAALGPVDIVVTSAGIAGFVPFTELSIEEWERTMAVNLTGTFHCVQAAIPDMVERRWGRIVTISSAAGQRGSFRQAHYAASKGGVIALTKALAIEYASKGITVNTIPPATVDTPMLRAAQAAGQIADAETIARTVPARRLGTPDDIAATCAFLCSDAAAYLTGQVVAVNGGAVT